MSGKYLPKVRGQSEHKLEHKVKQDLQVRHISKAKIGQHTKGLQDRGVIHEGHRCRMRKDAEWIKSFVVKEIY